MDLHTRNDARQAGTNFSLIVEKRELRGQGRL